MKGRLIPEAHGRYVKWCRQRRIELLRYRAYLRKKAEKERKPKPIWHEEHPDV